MTKYDMLPGHMQEGARAYIEDGRMPGHFLQAVLENDLVQAYSRADSVNAEAMQTWASWLYNECPGVAWHTRAAVDRWVKLGGAMGQGLRQEEGAL